MDNERRKYAFARAAPHCEYCTRDCDTHVSTVCLHRCFTSQRIDGPCGANPTSSQTCSLMDVFVYRARLARSNKEWSCELLYGNPLRATHLGFASARPLGSLPASHASAATLQLASDRPQGSAPRPVRPRIHSDDAISARSIISISVWSNNVSDQVRSDSDNLMETSVTSANIQHLLRSRSRQQ